MRPARSPILCSKLTMMTVLECQQGSKKFVLGPASTAFVCNVSEKGDRIHWCMHCSLRKDIRCMYSLFERRRPGHASLFDGGLVSPARCRKHVLNYRMWAIEHNVQTLLGAIKHSVQTLHVLSQQQVPHWANEQGHDKSVQIGHRCSATTRNLLNDWSAFWPSHARRTSFAPTKTNAKLAVRVHAFIALAIHVQYPSSLILHLKKRKIRPTSFKTSRSAIRFSRCCASAGDRQIDCGCTMKFNPYRCSLINECDIVNS